MSTQLHNARPFLGFLLADHSQSGDSDRKTAKGFASFLLTKTKVGIKNNLRFINFSSILFPTVAHEPRSCWERVF